MERSDYFVERSDYLWNEVTIFWNKVTVRWNEVTWNEVTMERSDRNSITRLTEILETFPRVFCFPKSRINENGGKTSIYFSFLFVDIYQKYACHTFARFKTYLRARCSFYF